MRPFWFFPGACSTERDGAGAKHNDTKDAAEPLHDRTADEDGRGPVGVCEVTVFRTEMITFRLPAASAQDAEERYLADGEEGSSRAVRLRVDSTMRLDPDAT